MILLSIVEYYTAPYHVTLMDSTLLDSILCYATLQHQRHSYNAATRNKTKESETAA